MSRARKNQILAFEVQAPRGVSVAIPQWSFGPENAKMQTSHLNQIRD